MISGCYGFGVLKFTSNSFPFFKHFYSDLTVVQKVFFSSISYSFSFFFLNNKYRRSSVHYLYQKNKVRGKLLDFLLRTNQHSSWRDINCPLSCLSLWDIWCQVGATGRWCAPSLASTLTVLPLRWILPRYQAAHHAASLDFASVRRCTCGFHQARVCVSVSTFPPPYGCSPAFGCCGERMLQVRGAAPFQWRTERSSSRCFYF